MRIDAVPVGRAEWPLITSGVAPAQAKEPDAAAAAVAAGFEFANLKPKRLTGRYEYTHEEAASVAGIEQALRRDLADAVGSKMSDQIVNGAAPTNAAPQNVEGFITKLTGSDLATGQADAADYGRLHALAVDGIHAGNEREVMSVLGYKTYQHAAGVYITGSGESGSELLARQVGRLHGFDLPSLDSVEEAVGAIARGRAGWWRDHARRFGGGYVADPRNCPGYLLQGVAGCRAYVGDTMGRGGCVPVGRLPAG